MGGPTVLMPLGRGRPARRRPAMARRGLLLWQLLLLALAVVGVS